MVDYHILPPNEFQTMFIYNKMLYIVYILYIKLCHILIFSTNSVSQSVNNSSSTSLNFPPIPDSFKEKKIGEPLLDGYQT